MPRDGPTVKYIFRSPFFPTAFDRQRGPLLFTYGRVLSLPALLRPIRAAHRLPDPNVSPFPIAASSDELLHRVSSGVLAERDGNQRERQLRPGGRVRLEDIPISPDRNQTGTSALHGADTSNHDKT